MVRRIKQYFIQKCNIWIEIEYIPWESVDCLVLHDHVLLPWRLDVRMC